MGALGNKLRNLEGGRLGYFCPGCNSVHHISIKTSSLVEARGWEWDGNVESPTFSPSILVTYNGEDAGMLDSFPAICHSFVTAGKIQFLNDCTHKLAGQTVDLPDFEQNPELATVSSTGT
jgi:hypothetical protein